MPTNNLIASCVTAIVPAFRRKAELLHTLKVLHECKPLPAEVIVHLDLGTTITIDDINTLFPAVRVIVSHKRVGPGGARNILIAAANTDWVASFDDDSYPEDIGYFAVLSEIAACQPDASIIAATARISGSAPSPASQRKSWVADFIGCACAYRRVDFLASAGYVELPVAYGMEEVDLALRYHAAAKRILRVEALRVFHDTALAHASSPAIVAWGIANVGLLVALRYPITALPLGLLQWARQLVTQILQGRIVGTVIGIMLTPVQIATYARYRVPISFDAIRSYRTLARQPRLHL
jgi:GT2 family glycosyltransferase